MYIVKYKSNSVIFSFLILLLIQNMSSDSQKGLINLYNQLSIISTSYQSKTYSSQYLTIGAPLNFSIERSLKTGMLYNSNSNSNSGSFEKSMNNKSNPKDFSSQEQVSNLII